MREDSRIFFANTLRHLLVEDVHFEIHRDELAGM